VDGEYFVCTALPFGYTNSPYVFTKVARHFSKLIRSYDGPVPDEGEIQDLGQVDPPFCCLIWMISWWLPRLDALASTSMVRVQKVLQVSGPTSKPG
jgi:hypothetical protein